MDYRTARSVLRTKPTATYTEIKSAFRQRALALHPDHNKSSGAPARFSTLVRAYKFLMNYRSPFQAERYKRKGNQRGRGLVRLVVFFSVSLSLNAATDLRITAPVAALQCDLETTGTVQLVPGLTKQLSSNRLPSGKLRILVYGLNQIEIPAGNFAVVSAPVTSVGNVVTANVNGTLSTATILVGSPPPPPPPPPPPSSESPSGTTIPPASKITDAGSAVWTVGANLYGRGPIPIRNSVNVAGGTWGCSKLLYQGSVVYCYGAQGWIRWTGTAWTTGSPLTPPPPPPPPVLPGPAITLTSPATRTLSLTRRPDNTGTQLPLTVNKDDCVRFNGVKVSGGLNCP